MTSHEELTLKWIQPSFDCNFFHNALQAWVSGCSISEFSSSLITSDSSAWEAARCSLLSILSFLESLSRPARSNLRMGRFWLGTAPFFRWVLMVELAVEMVGKLKMCDKRFLKLSKHYWQSKRVSIIMREGEKYLSYDSGKGSGQGWRIVKIPGVAFFTFSSFFLHRCTKLLWRLIIDLRGC